MILAAFALAALQPQASPQLMSVTLAWAQCVGSRAIARAGDLGAVENAADAAMRDCAAEEQAVERQLIADQGARGAGEMPALRRAVRARAVSAATERLGGAPTVARSPVGIWGECVGREGGRRVDGNLSDAAVAEAALGACRTEEEAARRYVVASQGEAEGERTIRLLRANTPAMIARYRASRRPPGN